MAAPSGMIEKYGLLYPKGHSVLAIELECYRTDAKEHFAGLNIPQAPYTVVKGMSALRKYIKGRGKPGCNARRRPPATAC